MRRTALDRRNYLALVDTTVELALKVGASDIISKIVEDLKDESEPFRRMVMECVAKVVEHLGVSDIDQRLEELLVDGVLYSFQEQTQDENDIMLNGFGTVVNALGQRAKPYLPQICGTIKWRLNNKNQDIRQQAADLISKVAPVMKVCEEEQLICHLGVVLYEYLGEEYPEVLGSILGALKSINAPAGRHVKDDAAGERFVAEIDAYFEKQTRKGTGKLRRFGWENRRSRGGVCSR